MTDFRAGAGKREAVDRLLMAARDIEADYAAHDLEVEALNRKLKQTEDASCDIQMQQMQAVQDLEEVVSQLVSISISISL